jgi:DNA-binding transcriptional ArsR family regulator
VHGSDDPRVRLLADLADPTRFAVLERLERGPASAGELAERVGGSPTQLANHLRRLRDAGLVTVTHQGRLAHYELAEPGLREILSMLNGLRGSPRRSDRPAPLAVTCYDHLAGQVGVALMDYLLDAAALEDRSGEGELKLGLRAVSAFGELGVELPRTPTRRMLAFACMDSRVGRPHLGGLLGAELARSLKARGWVEPLEEPRRLALTTTGRRALRRLGIQLPAATRDDETFLGTR